MSINKIRELLSEKISEHEEWCDKLNDSTPGHYGVEDWNVYISKDNIFVDIPTKSFTFKDVRFEFELLLGSSNIDDGFKTDFTKNASGQGLFIFQNDNIVITQLSVNFDLHLFTD